MNKLVKHPIAIVLLFLIGFMVFNALRNQFMELFADDGKITVSTKYFIIAAFNTFYTVIAYMLIKRYKLIDLSGLGKQKFKNWFLLLFPLYIVLINSPDSVEIFYNIPIINYIALILWALSVGLSEEFMLRGFVQSLFIKHFAKTKRTLIFSVVGAAFIFGVLHLVKFDKGLYGEITQVLYATFIAVMFGALLLRTYKIWPLVILHALIDVSGNLERFQVNETTIHLTASSPQGLTDSIVITFLLLPCFIYGLILLRKVNIEEILAKK